MDLSDDDHHRHHEDLYDVVDGLMLQAKMHDEYARSSLEISYGSDERGSEEEGSDDDVAEEKGQNSSSASDRKPDARVQRPKNSI